MTTRMSAAERHVFALSPEARAAALADIRDVDARLWALRERLCSSQRSLWSKPQPKPAPPWPTFDELVEILNADGRR